MLLPLKVIIADGHGLFRKMLTRLVADNDDLMLSGTATNLEELEQLVGPDTQLILMEMCLPKATDGIEFCSRLRQSHPHIGIIILTRCHEKPLMRRMREAGAQGFLLKNTAEEEEIQLALRRVAAGGTLYCKELTPVLTGGQKPCTLSGENRQLLRMICNGAKSVTIAKELCLSLSAIAKRRAKLMRDLGATNIFQLVQAALREGLIDWSPLFD